MNGPNGPYEFKASDEIQGFCLEALNATEVALFVTGPYADGMRSVWVNSAYVSLMEGESGALVGFRPRVLHELLNSADDAGAIRQALEAGTPIRSTIRTAGPGGTERWSQVMLSAIPDATGAPAHWFGVQIDVSEHIDRYTTQIASLAAEREEKALLDVVAQASDLFMDVDRPDTLGQVALLLAGSVVAWSGFYLNDGGLRHAEGIDSALPPSGQGNRHVRFAPGVPAMLSGIPRAMGATESLSDLRIAAMRPKTEAKDERDSVQDLLDGRVPGPVALELDATHPHYSASGWLLRDLDHRLPDGRPPTVEVHAVPGRRRVLGLLVAVPIPAASAQLPTATSTPSMSDVRERGFSPERVHTLLQLVARRAGTAIDNVRLYAREHRLAETLQRAMLPEQVEIPGLDVWTYYAPNSEHAQVGGDWYDVVPLDADTVGLVIGDVVGHDIEAAAAMGQLRSVVRSYAFEIGTPGPVLERVDQLVRGMRIPRSASLVYAALTAPVADEEAWAVQYSRAGHLPPLVVRDGQVILLDEAGGGLVGFGCDPRRTATARLEPGDAMILYTDGLIERRDRSLRQGLDALVAVSTKITSIDAAGIGEELLSCLAEAPEDDVALVVVRIPDPSGDDRVIAQGVRRRRWILPSEPASIGKARHAVVRTSQAWGLSDSSNAQLVVSELVANGVLHGWGHLSLRLLDSENGLRIEVEDSNPAPPVTTDGHQNRVGGFGMQIVGKLADWGWQPSGSGKVVWAVVRPATSRGVQRALGD